MKYRQILFRLIVAVFGLLFMMPMTGHAAAGQSVSEVLSQPQAYRIVNSAATIYNPRTKQTLSVGTDVNRISYVVKKSSAVSSRGVSRVSYVYLSDQKQGWIWSRYLKRAANATGPNLKNATAALSMNLATGQTLYAKNVNSPKLVASTAKLMTLYLVLTKVHSMKNGWNQVVTATQNKNLIKMSRDTEYGGFKFKTTHQYTVRDLVNAAVVQSSNNAAIALGEWVAGSNTKFVALMNQTAQDWHLTQTHFVSASGLENEDLKKFDLVLPGSSRDGANKLSASNLATIARKLLLRYPEIVDFSNQRTKKVDGQTLYNYNPLLEGAADYDNQLQVDGLKTGYTEKAGICYVGTAALHGNRIVTVILKDKNAFKDTDKLMKYTKTINVPIGAISLTKQFKMERNTNRQKESLLGELKLQSQFYIN